MSGHHHHHAEAASGDRRVLFAVAANMLLTVAQIVGGLFAGSLALIADALHNFSDAVSLGIAYAARRIARRPSDERMTFGYARAEVVAALINYTMLIVIGLYLIYEAVTRFLAPQHVQGWLMVAIAAVALVIDLATAVLTYAMSKQSMNIRAAFLHNVADALGSIGVIVAGVTIVFFGWWMVDPIVTVLIAGYILWQAFAEIGGSVRLLMQGAPQGLDVDALIAAIRRDGDVEDVHHVHAWMIDEHLNALEAHIVIADGLAGRADAIRARIKKLVRDEFGIDHSTLEIERASACCDRDHTQTIGHAVRHEGADSQVHAH